MAESKASTSAIEQRLAAVATDLQDACRTMAWQRRTIGRLRTLLRICELEQRPPRDREITQACAAVDEPRAAADDV